MYIVDDQLDGSITIYQEKIMELSQLEQFIAIAKNQTMTKAAQQLHISQPALSIGLKKLEED